MAARALLLGMILAQTTLLLNPASAQHIYSFPRRPPPVTLKQLSNLDISGAPGATSTLNLDDDFDLGPKTARAPSVTATGASSGVEITPSVFAFSINDFEPAEDGSTICSAQVNQAARFATRSIQFGERLPGWWRGWCTCRS